MGTAQEEKKLNLLEVVAGDTRGIPGVLLNPETETGVDCSGFTEMIFTARDKRGRKVIEKKLSLSGIIWDTDYVGDGTDGRYKLVFAERDTKNLKGIYKYDLEVDDGTSKDTPVRSFILIKEAQTK